MFSDAFTLYKKIYVTFLPVNTSHFIYFLQIDNSMKVSDIVINKINRLKTGYVFTYSDFDIPVKNLSALKMSLNRLVSAGKIVRLSKGQFYKPEISQFGSLRPAEYQIVKDLLEDDKKIIGYLTGISAFNKLGIRDVFVEKEFDFAGEKKKSKLIDSWRGSDTSVVSLPITLFFITSRLYLVFGVNVLMFSLI